MSSTISAEFARAATERDLLGALAALRPLPRRSTLDPELEFAGFRTALEGRAAGDPICVAYCDLAAAVRSIIQGALNHAWHPSPAELRMICDAKQGERLAEIAKARRREALAAEIAEHRSTIRRTPDNKVRAASAYEAFCRSNAAAKLNQVLERPRRP